MKSILIKLVYVLLLLTALSSCRTMASKSNLKLSKGTTLDAFWKERVYYDKGFFLEDISAKRNGRYFVYMTKISGATSGEIYFYAFANDKLIYWGYPYMFTRHQDPIIREIGEESFQYAQKLYNLNKIKL